MATYLRAIPGLRMRRRVKRWGAITPIITMSLSLISGFLRSKLSREDTDGVSSLNTNLIVFLVRWSPGCMRSKNCAIILPRPIAYRYHVKLTNHLIEKAHCVSRRSRVDLCKYNGLQGPFNRELRN